MKSKTLKLLTIFILTLFLTSCFLLDDEVEESSVDDGEYSHLIMIYLDGDNNLEEYAISDMNEMESADLDASELKIVVLIDRIDGYDTTNDNWTGTRLYEIVEDNDTSTINSTRISGMGLSSSGDSDELNMGDEETLSDFVTFVKESYDADLYSLVMWNHGGGWRSTEEVTITDDEVEKAVCWDTTSDSDSLYMAEVSQALDGQNLAVIGFDACLMGMLEVGYELKDCGDIMVASEETEPGDGWDYDTFLSNFVDTGKSGDDLSSAIVDSYGDYYGDYTLSAVDLTSVENVVSALDTFATALQTQDRGYLVGSKYSVTNFNNHYSDLSELAEEFSLLDGADELTTALNSYVLYNYAGGDYSDAGGVSIYFPYLSTGYYSEYDDYTAANIAFAGVSQWVDMLDYMFDFSVDDYEDNGGDDSTAEATNIDSTVQIHNFHEEADYDWYTFDAVSGTTYTITTGQVTGFTDTYLQLFDSSSNFITKNDDSNGYFSEITYECTSDDTLYIVCFAYNSSSTYLDGSVGDYNISLTSE